MTDIDYLRRRIRQELDSATAASSIEAELVHRLLAAHYSTHAVIALRSNDDRPDGPFLVLSIAQEVPT